MRAWPMAAETLARDSHTDGEVVRSVPHSCRRAISCTPHPYHLQSLIDPSSQMRIKIETAKYERQYKMWEQHTAAAQKKAEEEAKKAEELARKEYIERRTAQLKARQRKQGQEFDDDEEEGEGMGAGRGSAGPQVSQQDAEDEERQRYIEKTKQELKARQEEEAQQQQQQPGQEEEMEDNDEEEGGEEIVEFGAGVTAEQRAAEEARRVEELEMWRKRARKGEGGDDGMDEDKAVKKARTDV